MFVKNMHFIPYSEGDGSSSGLSVERKLGIRTRSILIEAPHLLCIHYTYQHAGQTGNINYCTPPTAGPFCSTSADGYLQ